MIGNNRVRVTMWLLIGVFAKSLRTQKLIYLMLFLSLFAGTTGLSAVMGLAQVDLEPKNEHLLADISQYYQIVSSVSGITLSEYQQLKADIPVPMVGYTSNILEGFPDITVLALDTLAMIEWRRFHRHQESAVFDTTRGTKAASGESRVEAQRGSVYFANAVTAELVSTYYDVTVISELPDNLLFTEVTAPDSQLQSDEIFSGVLLVQSLNESVQSHIRSMLPVGFRLTAPVELLTDNQLQSSFRLNLLAMGALMFVVCLFIVFNAYQLMLMKRQGTIQILQQVGFSHTSIVLILGFEALLLAVVTAAIGTAAGFSILLAVLPAIETLTGVSSAPGLTTFWHLMIQTQGASIIGVVCALWVSLQWQKHMSINLQRRPPNIQLALFFVAASACLLSMLVLLNVEVLHWSIPSTGMFVLTSCLLVIAVFPMLLYGVKRLLNTKNVLLKLSVSSAWQLSKHTKVAVCAFFIAVTCNIGMNVMVDSFRSATQSWLNVRLLADAYLYTQSEEDLRPLLSSIDAQITVIPRLGYYRSISGKPSNIYSYPSDTAHKKAMVFEASTDDVWETFSERRALLVNQQLAEYLQVGVGDTITLPIPTTATEDLSIPLTVAGVYLDYGNPRGQVLLDYEWMSEFAQATNVYALTFPTKENIESRIHTLNQALKDTALVYETQDLIEQSMGAFDATFIITDVMKLVTLAVAAMSLACSIVILLSASKTQDSILRSLGFSRRFVAIRQALEYYFLCTFAFLAALPFGLLLAWILIHVINRQAFGWSYAMAINGYPIAQVYFYSLLIVGGLISVALFRLSKKDIIDTGALSAKQRAKEAES